MVSAAKADIRRLIAMLRSQPALPAFAANAKIETSRTYSLWRGCVYRPRLLAWFATARPNSCVEQSTAEPICVSISLDLPPETSLVLM